MYESTGLPKKLWPKTMLAVIFLFNISPLYSHSWRLLNKVLNSWFRNYFRQYNPTLIIYLTTDFRPNQNRIYIYRAQAYLIIKEYKAERNKRVYKVILHSYLSYLVKYIVSNIYRIQVPVLNKVIITKNMIFDKNILYLVTREQEED